MTETVLMRSPDGEVQEVKATPAKIVPLMVRGWRQHYLSGDLAEELESELVEGQVTSQYPRPSRTLQDQREHQ